MKGKNLKMGTRVKTKLIKKDKNGNIIEVIENEHLGDEKIVISRKNNEKE